MTLTEAYNATLADNKFRTAQDFWERVSYKVGRNPASFNVVRSEAMAIGLKPVRPAKYRAAATINTAMLYNRETRRERA
jgi:hypothetical protein